MSLPEPRPAWTPQPPAPATGWGPPELGRRRADLSQPSVAESARALGYEEGLAEGYARAMERLVPVEKAFGALIAEAERSLEAIRKSADANVAALALVVARWLFQREVQVDPTILEGLVRRAAALLPAGAPIEISVHPTDLETLGGHLDLKEGDGRPIVVHWVGDPSLEPGGVRIIGPERLVDGRADVALRSLYERLVGE